MKILTLTVISEMPASPVGRSHLYRRGVRGDWPKGTQDRLSEEIPPAPLLQRAVKRLRRLSLALPVLLALTLALGSSPAARAGDPVAEALPRLKDAPMDELGTAIEQFADIEDPRVPKILQALLDGKLFYQNADGRVVIGEPADDGYALSDAASGGKLGSAGRFDVKKISLNNALRAGIREAIGRLELGSGDAAVRLKAVQAMSQTPDEKNIGLLRARLDDEKDPKVLEAIKTALALADIGSPDKSVRIKAIESIQSQVGPDVVNRLNALLEKSDAGEYAEPDSDVRHTAEAALYKIQPRLSISPTEPKETALEASPWGGHESRVLMDTIRNPLVNSTG